MSLLTNEPRFISVLKYVILGGCIFVFRTAIAGSIVRPRAQYAPKAVQIDIEGDKDVMGVSYSRMMKRVIKLEGWRGLLRGIAHALSIVPLAVTNFILSMCCPMGHNCMVFFFWNPVLDAVARYCILVLYGVPFTIFFVRSITTPEMLSFFNARRAFRTLLSPSERRRPWLLYLTPGLFLVIALEHALGTILTPDIDTIVAGCMPDLPFPYHMSRQALARLSLALLHATLLGPLEVIKIRLAIQYLQESTVVLTASQSDIPGNEQPATRTSTEISSAIAPVVRLRTDSDHPPYRGMFSCVQSIASEEGFETLYRAWWYTLFTSLIKFRNFRS